MTGDHQVTFFREEWLGNGVLAVSKGTVLVVAKVPVVLLFVVKEVDRGEGFLGLVRRVFDLVAVKVLGAVKRAGGGG